MAYHPDIPTPTGVVQVELAQMRENFQHLGPLAQVVGELQAVSELAPYIQAILGSRIVDHNLDVVDPPNGWYVRYQNGLQVAFHNVGFEGIPGGETREISWVPPAQFSAIFGGITSHVRRGTYSSAHLAAFRSGCRIDTGDPVTVTIAVTNATGVTRSATIFVFLIGLAVSS